MGFQCKFGPYGGMEKNNGLDILLVEALRNWAFPFTWATCLDLSN